MNGMKYDKLLAPTYIEKFSCIGGGCEDTCCAGWAVLIDEETYKKYKKVKESPIKSRLNKEIVLKRNNPTIEHAAKIKLKNGRCAFLSKQGLCDIYSTLGEKYLSHTCALYPRTINAVNNVLECSLILSCPEAARLVLLQNKMEFSYYQNMFYGNTINAEITTHLKTPQRWQDYFIELRLFILSVLQNRSCSFEKRLEYVGTFMNGLDRFIVPSSLKKIPTLIGQYSERLSDCTAKGNQDSAQFTMMQYLSLIRAIQILKEKNKIKSKRYLECLEIIYKGLEVKKEQELSFSSSKYEEGLKYYQAFLQEKSVLLENYFVNYVFERCVPIDAEKPSESFLRMNLYYQLIKLHLIGFAAFDKEILPEQVIRLIQSFSKTYDHDDETFSMILKASENMC